MANIDSALLNTIKISEGFNSDMKHLSTSSKKKSQRKTSVGSKKNHKIYKNEMKNQKLGVQTKLNFADDEMFQSSIGEQEMNNQEFIQYYGGKYSGAKDSSKLKISDLKELPKKVKKNSKIPKPPTTRKRRKNIQQNSPNYLNDTRNNPRSKQRNSSTKKQSKIIK